MSTLTIYDIAKIAGVSASTVSRALDNSDLVSAKTKEKILKIAQEQNFTRNTLARSLSSGKTGVIGLILPSLRSNYYATMVTNIEKCAVKHGYTLLHGNSMSDTASESRLLKEFQSYKVDGIIFFGGRVGNMNVEPGLIEELEIVNRETPLVLDSKVFDCDIPQIHYTAENTADKIVRHLKEVGCKSIGVLGGSKTVYASLTRYHSFILAATRHGLDFIENDMTFQSGFAIKPGHRCMEHLIKTQKLPDAICCTNDNVAYGALAAAFDNNLSVPKDLMITAADDTDFCSVIRPSLTSNSYNLEEYSNSLFEKLLSLIDFNFKYTEFVEKVEVIPRDSTKRRL